MPQWLSQLYAYFAVGLSMTNAMRLFLPFRAISWKARP